MSTNIDYSDNAPVYSEPTDVRCPKCGAPAGDPCETPSGMTTTPHSARHA